MQVDLSPGLGYVPVMWTLFTLLAFIISYSLAVVNGHLYPVLPSISDTGSNLPESSIFSLTMNISVILGICNYFIRYFQCQQQARQCGDSKDVIFRANKTALMIALTSLGGALLVANVPSKAGYYLVEVHDAGAMVLFTCASIYFWVQVHISYKVAIYGLYSMLLCHFRLVITFLMSTSSALYFVTSAVSYHYFVVNNPQHGISQWGPGDGGYTLHVISNASEWLGFICIMVMAMTFFEEFQQVMLLIECQEKSPTIVSYDGIGSYTPLKMNSLEQEDGDDALLDNNN